MAGWRTVGGQDLLLEARENNWFTSSSGYAKRMAVSHLINRSLVLIANAVSAIPLRDNQSSLRKPVACLPMSGESV
jgi:hypothetical protein